METMVDAPLGRVLEDAKNWRCGLCGASPVNLRAGEWRIGFDGWEHFHDYPVGHYPAKRVTDSADERQK